MSFDLDGLLQNIRPVVPHFLRSADYAGQLVCSRWDFAVEINQLIQLGLNCNDLRWLIRNNLIEHRQELTGIADEVRTFKNRCNVGFDERSCFVLTDLGIDKFRRLDERPTGQTHRESSAEVAMLIPLQGSQETPACVAKIRAVVPTWDSDRRVLGFDGLIVKRFKWNAMNQQAVLIAFQEEGWPPRIFDPLPPQADQDAKRRLSDTIKCLNRKQCHPVLHFRGDGTGEGVIWETTGKA